MMTRKISCRFCRASVQYEAPGTPAQMKVALAELDKQCNCKPRREDTGQ